jgi:Ca-activated chloride channel family protein
MDKKQLEGNGGTRQYTSFFPFFIALMILILIAEVFIPETKKKAMYEKK